MTYYLRGPIVADFFFEVRAARIPYFSVLESIKGKDYIFFKSTIGDPKDIITFSVKPSGIGYIFTGLVSGKTFFLSIDEDNMLVPATEGKVFLPVTEQAINFSVFLAGLPFYLMIPEKNIPAAFFVLRNDGYAVVSTEFFPLPRTVYSPGGVSSPFPDILTLERSYFLGEKIVPYYTNKIDAYFNQFVAYDYCKDSLCAKPCKGGCLKSDQICLTSTPGEANFSCMNFAPEEVPYYKTPTFIAAATTVGIVLLLSIILAVIVFVLKK